MLTSREKSEFLCRERDVWTALQEEKAAQELAKERLVRKCDEAADLQRQCSELEAEARDAREKVAPLEKKVNDLGDALVREAQEWSVVAERYQGVVIQVETLLT